MARRLTLALLAAGVLVGLLAPSAAASFTVMPPTARYAGKAYGQWSAAWWQWAANVSEPNSPVDDPTGKNCAVNQNGPVWFLAGTPGTSSPHCTVPAGKAILVPVVNGECSTLEPPPAHGTNETELRACAVALMDHVTDLGASVDGVPVDLGPGGSRFRFQSPLFAITFAPNNGFYPDGSVAGTGASVADGFWVLLRPLAAGQHEIDFHGTAPFPEFGFTFQIDVHYHVTVSGQR
ncbi:MAG TPA: hypothetical protein VGM21_08255 [Actinomycetota bacterium]|jgi:hypothetical protein